MASKSLGGIGLQLSQLREDVVEVNEECALHVFLLLKRPMHARFMVTA